MKVRLLYFLSTEALIDCIAFSSIKNVVKDGLRPANEPTIVPVSPGKPCIFLPDLLETKFPVVHLEEYSSPFSVVNGAKETLKNFSRESLHASFESTGQKLQCLYITIQLEHDSEVYFACSTVSQRDHIFKRLRYSVKKYFIIILDKLNILFNLPMIIHLLFTIAQHTIECPGSHPARFTWLFYLVVYLNMKDLLK